MIASRRRRRIPGGWTALLIVLLGIQGAAAQEIERTPLRRVVFSPPALDFGIRPSGTVSDPVVVTIS
jgi:hypothetical protein